MWGLFWHLWRLRGFDGQLPLETQLIRRHFCCSCLWNSFAWFYKAEIFSLLPFFFSVSFPMTQSSHHTFLLNSCHGLSCIFYCCMPLHVLLASYNAFYLFTSVMCFHSLSVYSFLFLNLYQDHIYFLHLYFSFCHCALLVLCAYLLLAQGALSYTSLSVYESPQLLWEVLMDIDR